MVRNNVVNDSSLDAGSYSSKLWIKKSEEQLLPHNPLMRVGRVAYRLHICFKKQLFPS